MDIKLNDARLYLRTESIAVVQLISWDHWNVLLVYCTRILFMSAIHYNCILANKITYLVVYHTVVREEKKNSTAGPTGAWDQIDLLFSLPTYYIVYVSQWKHHRGTYPYGLKFCLLRNLRMCNVRYFRFYFFWNAQLYSFMFYNYK